MIRQPRLILTLVLGPFLIMLVFGLGYRNQARELRTVFVVKEGPEVAEQVRQYGQSLGPQLIYEGITDDEANAFVRLARGEVDLVAVVPVDASDKIQDNEQAIFNLYHNEIDPFQVGYVQFAGRLYVDELNRRVLQRITAAGQEQAASYQDSLAAARSNAAAMREALESGDEIRARLQKERLNQNVNLLTIALGTSLGVIGGVEDTLGAGPTAEQALDPLEVLELLQDLNEQNDALDLAAEDQTVEEKAQEIRKIESKLEILDETLTDFQSMEPFVLVSPFESETHNITGANFNPTEFFAPAVIVLLIQHLAVTFAALSLVRERRHGAMELFQVSPISALETLLGKYLSYLIFGTLLAAVISALAVFVLGVPMFGYWPDYGVVLIALLFTALGFGFLVSTISETDTQAVQFSMLLLLASVFFSGFFLDLRLMWEPIRAVSWALPATFGIRMLHNVMLRGYTLDPQLIAGLLGIGVALFLLVWLLLRRQLSRV